MFKKLMLLVIIVSIAACSQTRHYVNGYSVEGTREVKDDTDYFISGLAQKENVTAADMCGGKASDVVATETYRSPKNIVLHVVSGGIYSPQERTVFCRR